MCIQVIHAFKASFQRGVYVKEDKLTYQLSCGSCRRKFAFPENDEEKENVLAAPPNLRLDVFT